MAYPWHEMPGRNDPTGKKGDAAVLVVCAAIRNNKFPLWVCGAVTDDREIDIQGTDIIIQAQRRIQVKYDWLACPEGTNNVFIQTHECNPLKQYSKASRIVTGSEPVQPTERALDAHPWMGTTMKNLLQSQLSAPGTDRPESQNENVGNNPPIYTPSVAPTIDDDFYRYVAPDGKVWALPKGVFITLDNWRSTDGTDARGTHSRMLYQAPEETKT